MKWDEGENVERGVFHFQSFRHLSSEWPSQVSVVRELEGANYGINRRFVGPERDESVVGWGLVATGQAGEGGRRVRDAERQAATMAQWRA